MSEPDRLTGAARVWNVGALCRAVADVLEARFNPVSVRGELSGFTRASSGHCYFTLKDAHGQMRCAMFRRAASQLNFVPEEGELVELRGRLAVYDARGELQLVVDSMAKVGAGVLYEQFLRVKAGLEAEGLFDAARKRGIPVWPRGVGVVTSSAAAAWRDVMTTLKRRAPHVPIFLAPAAVQGTGAPRELTAALQSLFQLNQAAELDPSSQTHVDVILLVRGGGSMEDLWAFNDEALARCIASSPVPVISGVGHETDFTIADFVADLRAPTPTAAAELVSQPSETWLRALDLMAERLQSAAYRTMDSGEQRLDQAVLRLGRPSARIATQQALLRDGSSRLRRSVETRLQNATTDIESLAQGLRRGVSRATETQDQALQRFALRMELQNPRQVLSRGFAWLSDASGQSLGSVQQIEPGQFVKATLADGEVDLSSVSVRPN